jgi:CubicO group peptidase (beta-lactamase class C family)
MNQRVEISGYAAPGFEQVADVFARNFTRDEELGAAFVAIRDGAPVVDIWGGVADKRTQRMWRQDTLQIIFSGSKGLLATMILMLVDRGLLDLDSPVRRYWPEFGKEDIRVRHVVSHAAGLPGLEAPVGLADLTDDRGMAALLARQIRSADPRAAHCYHALTFGWLVGEIIRRVSGRSPGRFLAEEIAAPLSLEIWIGLPETQEPRVASLSLASNWGAAPFFDAALWARDPLVGSIWGNPPLWGGSMQQTPETFAWNTRAFHAAEIPGANAIATARAMAGFYACLAAGGAPLLSAETLSFGCRTLSDGVDAVHGARLHTGVGFQLQSELRPLGPPADAFGHTGAGGSCHGAWPEQRIGFSYAMNLMHDPTVGDQRALRVLSALHDAATAKRGGGARRPRPATKTARSQKAVSPRRSDQGPSPGPRRS